MLAKNGASSDRRAQRTHPRGSDRSCSRHSPMRFGAGYNEAARSDAWSLLRPLRDPRHLSRYVLNWLSPRTKTRNSPKSSSKTRSSPRDHPRYAHHSRRPRWGHALQAGQSVDGGPRRDEESLTAHVSNDNPFSEAAFKTLKYCPTFPHASGASRTLGSSVKSSSPITTTNTDTPALVCTPPRRCTTARTWRFVNSAK